ncbi:hypothetical protein IJM86_07515 [bacterium]|nr:hypothetical protein [bacterium]
MLRNDVKQKAQPTSKKRHKKIYYGQWIIFILSLIIATAVFYIAYEFLSERAYVLASFMGFLAYVILGKMLDVAGFHKIRALFTAWIYYLLLLFSLLYT